jgi:L-alanine-DL-glutamate epimerase-like enolase superfamily enzyme
MTTRPTRRLVARHEVFPIRGSFTISRGSRTEAHVVLVEIAQGGAVGRGECVPYPRYGESIEQTLNVIAGTRELIEGGGTRAELRAAVGAGAARNALDCALWDLEAKLSGRPVWDLAGLGAPQPLTTAYTISLGTPAAMAEAAGRAAARPLLKVKLGGEGDVERVRAVRAAAPEARLIVDANEAWTPAMVEPYGEALAGLGVLLIEQPLPAGEDGPLAGMARPVPLGADESCHTREGLAHLRQRYDVVNIKLDKTGGLTEALAMAGRARELGFEIMLGCMVGTSLAMAPSTLLGGLARFVDLDGPLLLARDREPGLCFTGSVLAPPPPELWG